MSMNMITLIRSVTHSITLIGEDEAFEQKQEDSDQTTVWNSTRNHNNSAGNGLKLTL